MCAASDFIRDAAAASTRSAYRSDWRLDFAAWCAARGAKPLPATPAIVAATSPLGARGRKASTIGRRAAAIGYHHKLAGHEPPTSGEGVRAVLRGIRRTIGTAKTGKAPATARPDRPDAGACPDTLIGKRDRALLAPGLRRGVPAFRAGARSRSPISSRSPTDCGC